MANDILPDGFEYVDDFYEPPKNASERVERAIKATAKDASERARKNIKPVNTKQQDINPVSEPVSMESQPEPALPDGFEYIDANDSEPVDFDLGTMVSNIPESAAGVATDLYNVFRHPVDTATGLWNVGSGAVQKLIPGEQGNEPYADMVGNYFSNRYGGMDEIKRTAMEDPVGMLSDTAGALSGIGLLGKGSKIGEIGRFGSMIDPANLAISGGSKLLMNTPGIKNVPNALYQSSAKFGNKVDADAVTKTALDRGITPTDTGIAKAQGIIDAIDTQITDLIEQSSKSGGKIPRSKMYQYLKDVRQELGGFNLDAPANMRKINQIVGDFEQSIKGKGKDYVTAAEAQKFKQDIYKTINWKKKQGTGSQAGETTRKAIARAAKDEIEKIIPEIKDLNLEMGDMLELVDAIEAPAKRIRNRDVLGLGTAAKTTAGGVAGGVPGAFAGFVTGILDNPTLKANIAIGLNKIKNMNISNSEKRVLALELLRNSQATMGAE